MDNEKLIKETLCELKKMNETMKTISYVLVMINSKLDKVAADMKKGS